MTDPNRDPLDRTRPIDRVARTERLDMPRAGAPATSAQHPERPPERTVERPTERPAEPAGAGEPAEALPRASSAPAAAKPAAKARTLMAGLASGTPQRAALVVLVGIAVLTVAFLIMIFVNVSTESVIALAVIATPIASMVAAYYAVTLSIQQVRTERDDKERALAKVDAVQENARETEIWASQMESGLRVAMAKLDAAGVSTASVTRAAGTPDDFF
jgi:hypothetical protein